VHHLKKKNSLSARNLTKVAATDCAAATLAPEGDLDRAKYTVADPEFDDNDLDDNSDHSDTISDSTDEAPAKKKHKPSTKEPVSYGKRKQVESELPSTPAIPLATPFQPEPSAPKATTTTMQLGEVTVTFEDPTAGIAYEQLTYQQQVDRNRLRNQALGALWRRRCGVVMSVSRGRGLENPLSRLDSLGRKQPQLYLKCPAALHALHTTRMMISWS
jgi:hypothetical protein